MRRQLFQFVTKGPRFEKLHAEFIVDARTTQAQAFDWESPLETYLRACGVEEPLVYIKNMQIRLAPKGNVEDLLAAALRTGCQGLGVLSIRLYICVAGPSSCGRSLITRVFFLVGTIFV